MYLHPLTTLCIFIFSSATYALPTADAGTGTSRPLDNSLFNYTSYTNSPTIKMTTDLSLFIPPNGKDVHTNAGLQFECRTNAESPRVEDVQACLDFLNVWPIGYNCPLTERMLHNECKVLFHHKTAVVVICGNGQDRCRDLASWLGSTFVTSDWCQRHGRTEGSIKGFGRKPYYAQLEAIIYRAW